MEGISGKSCIGYWVSVSRPYPLVLPDDSEEQFSPIFLIIILYNNYENSCTEILVLEIESQQNGHAGHHYNLCKIWSLSRTPA